MNVEICYPDTIIPNEHSNICYSPSNWIHNNYMKFFNDMLIKYPNTYEYSDTTIIKPFRLMKAHCMYVAIAYIIIYVH